jgi:hypothetical protein
MPFNYGRAHSSCGWRTYNGQIETDSTYLPESAQALAARDGPKKQFRSLRSLPAPSTGLRVCGVGKVSFRCLCIDSDHIGPFVTEFDLYRHLYEHVY